MNSNPELNTMMNTDHVSMTQFPGHPPRITRRTFVKRSSATVIATAFALHSFRNEAWASIPASSFEGLVLSETKDYTKDVNGCASIAEAKALAETMVKHPKVTKEKGVPPSGSVPASPPVQEPAQFEPKITYELKPDGSWSFTIRGVVVILYYTIP